MLHETHAVTACNCPVIDLIICAELRNDRLIDVTKLLSDSGQLHLFCSCHGRGALHFLWMLLAMCLLRWAAKTKRQKRRRCQCHLWGGHGFWWCEMWFHNFLGFWHETWFPDCTGFCDAISEWLIRIQLICYMHPVGLLHRSSWFVTYPSCSVTHPTDIEATGGYNIYNII